MPHHPERMNAMQIETPPTEKRYEKPEGEPEPEERKKPATISAKNVRVDFHKPWLANESDVEEYLSKYREALLEEINQGKKVQL